MIAEATTALVTGAIGALGRAIAQALAAEGARVVDAGRREGALRHLAASLRPRLPRAPRRPRRRPRTTPRRKPPGSTHPDSMAHHG